MNCLEVRRSFTSLWRRTLADDARAALMQHFAACLPCDQSFRHFALTAPVLHGEPRGIVAPDPLPRSEDNFAFMVSARNKRLPWRLLGGAFTVAAAAAAILCFFRPPHVTFEDAFADDNYGMAMSALASDQTFSDISPVKTPVNWVKGN